MKKMKLIFGLGALALFLNSCVIMSTHTTTGNPIGTKTGVVKSKMGDSDAGIAAAAKEGKITKIGSVDVKILSSGKMIVMVTGE